MDKLPEKWYVKCTNDEFPIVIEWARKVSGQGYSNFIHHDLVSFNEKGIYRNEKRRTQISFEDFKKLVLKQDNMKELKITEEKVKETIKNHPESRNILESLFPEVEEVVYKVGSRFIYGGDAYLLCRTNDYEVNLFCMRTGNRWGNPIRVQVNNETTLSEFKNLTGQCVFTYSKD